MALTNAERQKKFRESNALKLQEFDSLRNEVGSLKQINDQLRNEINSLNSELEALRNNSQPTTITPALLDARSSNVSFSSEPALEQFDIPIDYCTGHAFNGFTRRTPTLWTYAHTGSSRDWKNHYQIHIEKSQLWITKPANQKSKTITSFSYWESVVKCIDAIIERIENNDII